MKTTSEQKKIEAVKQAARKFREATLKHHPFRCLPLYMEIQNERINK